MRTEQEVPAAWPWDVSESETPTVKFIQQGEEDGKQECRISDMRRPGENVSDAHATVSLGGLPYSEWASSYMTVDTQNEQERVRYER